MSTVREALFSFAGKERPVTTAPVSLTARLASATPNGLSLLRLVLGLVFPCLPADWRLPALVVGALTDMLDGAASRLFHASSTAGRLLDPLADKVFALGVLATLLIDGTLAPRDAVLVSLRDLAVMAGAAWLLIRGDWSACLDLHPRLLGKATTAAQFIFFIGLILSPSLGRALLVPTALLSGLATADMAWAFLPRLCCSAATPRA